MSDYTGVKIAWGAVGSGWASDELGPKIIEALREGGIKEIDTARTYPDSEELLGKRGVPNEFIVSTKWSGAWQGIPATREEILKSAETSFSTLKTDQV